MSNKIKILYELHQIDENARPKIEAIIHSLMDWVQVNENEWLVLSNRLNATDLQNQIESLLKSKYSKVSVIKQKNKTRLFFDGFIAAKTGGAGEELFSAKY
jgi:hypothetical protein